MVRGASGLGKTALVQQFVAGVERDPEVLVLSGRCYEREFVPFKAFDGVIDALCAHLRSLPPGRVEPLLPGDMQALARMFPALQRIGAVKKATAHGAAYLDERVLRRRAFVALRELFGRLCDERRLVVFIDNLQWGDEDSAALLEELVGPPDPPPVFYVASSREGEDTSGLVARLTALGSRGSTAEVQTLSLSPLGADETLALARRLLPRAAGPEAATRSLEIARESGGSPYFVGELVRFSEARSEPGGERPASLSEVVTARTAALPDPAQRLLHVIALAGRVVPAELAASVANLAGHHDALDALLGAKLVRRIGSTDDVVPFHDRVREAIAGSLAEQDARRTYERIAVAVEATGRPEAEWLCELYQGAKMTTKAGTHAVLAGDRAAEGLAFTRAADHYRFALGALELSPGD